MSNKVTNFLTKNNIVMDLDATSKEDAIQKLAAVMQKNGIITDTKQYVEDVMDRESKTTTGIGKGIAIPHGKSVAVNSASLVFAKNKRPLEWNSLDGKPIQIIFLMAVAENDQGDEHLRVLAKLSGKLMDDSFVAAIKAATSAEQILDIFDQE